MASSFTISQEAPQIFYYGIELHFDTAMSAVIGVSIDGNNHNNWFVNEHIYVGESFQIDSPVGTHFSNFRGTYATISNPPVSGILNFNPQSATVSFNNYIVVDVYPIY